ncbi:glycoside hydrolase family 25 protein [Longimicrobium sp.]|uniref:glycoside hydrolase family 25 protein n=1 Tax=Longimicrobium sp. TaxID=2029185 RepID=UPI002E303C39|nr:GH25 family lysozyme [Longimicrobium sp.]
MKHRSGRAWMRVAAAVALSASAACGDLATAPAPDGDRLAGVDVSHWQGAIDWNRAAGDGVSFAFIKATEGGDYVDPAFAANWAGAAAAGIPRGAYHFYRPQTDAAAQAQHFLRTVQLRAGDLPPVLDVEVTDGRPAAEIAAGVRTWLQTVERATGRRPIVYTRASFWTGQMGGGFGAYPLWVAHYGAAQPSIPADWSRWAFWQHSDAGRVAGITGDVDLNWFAGSWADLQAFIQTGAFSHAP